MRGLIILYPLFFLIVFLFNRKKREHLLYNIVILLYFFAGLAAFYIYHNLDTYLFTPLDFGAICYHLILILLLLVPLRKFDERIDLPIEDNNLLTKLFTFGIIACSIIYIIDGIQYVSMSSIVADVTSLRYDLMEGSKRTNSSLIGYIAYVIQTLWVAPLVLTFYYLIKSPEKKILIILLFVCSLSSVIVELRFAAREFLIKYIYISCCMYVILRKQIPIKIKQLIIRVGMILFVIILSIFILITFLRFGSKGDTSTTDSLLNYFGQGFVNFSEGFMLYPDGVYPKKGVGTAPFFVGEGRSPFNANDQVNSFIELNIFRTTIGSWLLDCGIYWTILISLIYAFLFNVIGRNKNNNVFSYIYIALVLDFSFSLLFFFHENITGTRLAVYFGLFVIDYMSRSLPNITKTT